MPTSHQKDFNDQPPQSYHAHIYYFTIQIKLYMVAYEMAEARVSAFKFIRSFDESMHSAGLNSKAFPQGRQSHK